MSEDAEQVEPRLLAEGLVLVSACLLGRACTYRADDNADDAGEAIRRLADEGRAVPICPEVDGGLPTPRPAAELQGGGGGDVLDGAARVATVDGADVTDAYVRGAELAVERAVETGARLAILKARSPSCGCHGVYDGSFSRRLVDGEGVTAAALRRAGVTVRSEEELPGEA